MWELITYGPPVISRDTEGDSIPEHALILDDQGPLLLDDGSYLILE